LRIARVDAILVSSQDIASWKKGLKEELASREAGHGRMPNKAPINKLFIDKVQRFSSVPPTAY